LFGDDTKSGIFQYYWTTKPNPALPVPIHLTANVLTEVLKTTYGNEIYIYDSIQNKILKSSTGTWTAEPLVLVSSLVSGYMLHK
jgi:hypothetical protein